MSKLNVATKACHGCRRRRWKCDRSYPQCHKCIQMGQECLGYQGLFLWNKGVASRGKMMGMTFDDIKHKEDKQPQAPLSTNAALYMSIDALHSPLPTNCITPGHLTGLSPTYSLIDPLFQDLDQSSRYYLNYFASHVCKELVIYDVPPHNPFRDLIPLTREHPTLFHVIVANSALRISNALQRPILTRPSSLPLLQSPTSNESSCIPVSSMHVSSEYKDALSSKQIALRLLRQALENRQSIDLDIVLASVLLFIEFELIDSGKNDWRLHMNGARTLIDSLPSSYDMDPSSMSPMRICLVSNCLVYEILGSTLACLTPSSTSDTSSTQLVPALEYAEANNYLSCPATLLQLTLAATELLRPMSNHSTVNSTAMTIPPAQQVFLLLQTAQSFDASIWATSLQKVSPQKDVGKRAHIASAHKAAVCIYLSRALLSFSQAARISDGLESLVSDVVHHLSFIPNGNELFKSTSWPTFIAGAETKDLAHQEWAVTRLHKVWGVCPWGYIRSAIEILDLIWEERNGAADNGNASMNWVQELRSLKVNWLIA